jgi:hypothetical protein
MGKRLGVWEGEGVGGLMVVGCRLSVVGCQLLVFGEENRYGVASETHGVD